MDPSNARWFLWSPTSQGESNPGPVKSQWGRGKAKSEGRKAKRGQERGGGLRNKGEGEGRHANGKNLTTESAEAKEKGLDVGGTLGSLKERSKDRGLPDPGSPLLASAFPSPRHPLIPSSRHHPKGPSRVRPRSWRRPSWRR
jgi:hypothetical protein